MPPVDSGGLWLEVVEIAVSGGWRNTRSSSRCLECIDGRDYLANKMVMVGDWGWLVATNSGKVVEPN